MKIASELRRRLAVCGITSQPTNAKVPDVVIQLRFLIDESEEQPHELHTLEVCRIADYSFSFDYCMNS